MIGAPALWAWPPAAQPRRQRLEILRSGIDSALLALAARASTTNPRRRPSPQRFMVC